VKLHPYSVRAKNTSADSDNKIHDDAVARQYGFSGGLVPGVAVYGYMTVPVVEKFSHDWLGSGAMQVKFHQPVYDGEEVIVRGEVDDSIEPVKAALRVERPDGAVCATGLATINDRSQWLWDFRLEDCSRAEPPPSDSKPLASSGAFTPGQDLGAFKERIERIDHDRLLCDLSEQLEVYRSQAAVAHPTLLLGLANQLLMRNFKLGPWIHAGSDLINWSEAMEGEDLTVTGRVADCYERKGHEFVVLNVAILSGDRLVQQIRHTAIYRPRAR
jgi:hypothetical protein